MVMREDFICRIADWAEENYLKKGKCISRLAFVFGGRRPALFLKKELGRRIKSAFISPAFYSIDEFTEYIVSKKHSFGKITDLEACFIVYTLLKDAASPILKGRDKFSQFLPWAREIIGFIEELDLEKIESSALENIQEKASIGYDVPESINQLLKSIISLRTGYQRILRDNQVYSRGFIYSLASEYVKDLDFSEFDEVIFCDFYYPHKAEEEVINVLCESKKARHILAQDASNPEYNLKILAGFDIHSQVSLAREILKKIDGLDKTVVVLPKPDSLIPLVSEISSYVPEFNVSMGYPLKRSSLYALFDSIIKAQETKKDNEYYSKDYLKVMNHPLVKNLRLSSANPAVTRILVHKIEEALSGIEEVGFSGKLFIELSELQNSRPLYDLALTTMKAMDIEVVYDELKEVLRQLNEIFFVSWEKLGNFSDFSFHLEKFVAILVNKSLISNYPLNLKMAERIYSIIEEMKFVSFSNELFPREDIFKIFQAKLDNTMISFSGSPLKGLQVLGLLETRSLNFDNVIIMDVNETALPNLKVYEPLIPREVMIGLGLNRLEKEEQIQRGQFKRLTSNAKNVYLIYAQDAEREKSRFIEELIWEEQKKKQALEVLNIPRVSFQVKVLPKRLEIKKVRSVIDFLKAFTYSASSINAYLACPLRFYYQYILGLREKENLLDETEAVDIGRFLHQLLEEAFARFIFKKPLINNNFRKEFFAVLDKKFSETFENKMKADAFLLKEILVFRMERFLDAEKERDVSKILALEKKFNTRIKLEDYFLKFEAVIDRIDELSDGSILILDYKSGAAGNLPSRDIGKIETAGFCREALKKTIKSFQLPLYLYFLDNAQRYKGAKINAGLYALKDLGLSVIFKKEEEFTHKDELMQVYLKALGALLKDILEPGLPFKADEEDPHHCASCPFFYLCR